MTEKTIYANAESIQSLTLGQTVGYQSQYSPDLLQPVPRSLNREEIGLSGQNLPFQGTDIWNGYELSWLTPKGLPQIAILRCYVPHTTPNIIESKSFKLYLNSLNQTAFENADAVSAVLQKDLSECAGGHVDVEVIKPSEFTAETFVHSDWVCLDDRDIAITQYSPDPSLLQTTKQCVQELKVYSNLLKSNCLVTDQPDWATVFIKYSGAEICPDGLLKYLISFREHNEFHEQCVERIFTDIMAQAHPSELTVYARYTRRGGLDINPFRSNFEAPYPDWRLVRQ